jgi:predicted Fe-S protein YdhL (DUF1289 family)
MLPSHGKIAKTMIATQLIADRAMSVRAIAENVPSPCISVCRMNVKGGLCQGCWRTLQEIRVWRALSDSEKKTIWAIIEQRIAATTS